MWSRNLFRRLFREARRKVLKLTPHQGARRVELKPGVAHDVAPTVARGPVCSRSNDATNF